MSSHHGGSRSSLSSSLWELILPFVDNHEFYMVLPMVSHYLYNTLVSDDVYLLSCSSSTIRCCVTTDQSVNTSRSVSDMKRNRLHLNQCRSRFQMNETQWLLFSHSTWPRLHMNILKYAQLEITLQNQSCGMLQARYEAETGQRLSLTKQWTLECIHLYHHLYFSSLYLFRHAPTHTDSGQRLLWRLPQLLQSLLIDQLTSFYVSHPLSGYQGIQYGREQYLLPINYSFLNTLVSNTGRGRNTGTGRTAMKTVSEAQSVDKALQCQRRWSDDETELKSLLQWYLTVLPSHLRTDDEGHTALFEDELTTIAYCVEEQLYQSAKVPTIPSFNYVMYSLWFGPQMRSINTMSQSIINSQLDSRVDVDLSNAAVVCLNLDPDSFDCHPQVMHVSAFVRQGCLALMLRWKDIVRINRWISPTTPLRCAMHISMPLTDSEWQSYRRKSIKMEQAGEKYKRGRARKNSPSLFEAFLRESSSSWWDPENDCSDQPLPSDIHASATNEEIEFATAQTGQFSLYLLGLIDRLLAIENRVLA